MHILYIQKNICSNISLEEEMNCFWNKKVYVSPLGIVVEMIRAAGDMGASMIRDLAAAIICDGKVPSEWEQSFILCLYKGKGDALERGNYRGLKLTEQVMKIVERIVDGLIRQLVSIGDSQFGFVPGRGTTDTIFVVRQLQEKYLAANKRLYMAFVDLEKAFDRVPWKSSGWRWENLVWRSGLCDWCRGCMQMCGAMSVLVRGTVKSLKWRLVFTKDQYSAHCSSSLCLKPYHESSALGSPGKTSMLMTLLSSLNRLRNVSGGSWHEKKQWRRKNWELMQERQRLWSAVRDWISCRVQVSFHVPSVVLEWAATASSAIAANTGCTRNAVGSSAWKKTLTTDVHGARELQAPWMADHRRKSRSDLTSLRW